MAQTQFISHIQVTPPPAIAPRRGSGAFSAAVLVISILIGAATGGVVLWERQLATQAEEAQRRLAQLKDDFGVDSIKKAKQLQQRIAIAQQLLNEHAYGSQAVNFIEESMLAGVVLTKYNYSEGKLTVSMEASGYLAFAQQVQYMRSLIPTKLSEIKFTEPSLTENGTVKFDMTLALSSAFIHEKPTQTFFDSTPTFEDGFGGNTFFPLLLGGSTSATGSGTGTSSSPRR